jgi:hypothetical protein
VHRPVPRATVGRGFFVPNLEGRIKNATSALPGGRSGSPSDLPQSGGSIQSCKRSSRRYRPKSSQLADETASLIYRNEPRCRTIAVSRRVSSPACKAASNPAGSSLDAAVGSLSSVPYGFPPARRRLPPRQSHGFGIGSTCSRRSSGHNRAQTAPKSMGAASGAPGPSEDREHRARSLLAPHRRQRPGRVGRREPQLFSTQPGPCRTRRSSPSRSFGHVLDDQHRRLVGVVVSNADHA